MKYKVYLQGNSVVIETVGGTGYNKEFIGLNFFSFEAVKSTGNDIQLLDSSKDNKVVTIKVEDFLNEAGTGFVDLNEIVEYLSTFNSFANVKLEEGSKVRLVDEDLAEVPQLPNIVPTSTAKGIILLGEDTTGNLRRIRTTISGELVASASVSNPPTTIPFTNSEAGSVSTSTDLDFIIPNGDRIVIQNLSGGAEADSDGSKVELFVFEDNTKTVGELLSVLYVNGSNASDTINRTFEGNSSRIVTLRRSRLSGSSKEIFGKYQGYTL